MSETSHYMTPTPRPVADMSADYRFAANNDVVEEAEIYENIVYPKPTSNTTQQEQANASSQQSKNSQEKEFKYNRILITAAFALFLSLALAAIALGMAIQAGNKMAEVQVEVGKLNDELDIEVDERKHAEVALKSSVAAQVMQINNQADINHDILIHRQNNLVESTNVTFVLFQRNLDLLSQKHDLSIYRQDNMNETMATSFTDLQEKLDLFSRIFGIRLVGGTSNSGRVEIFHDGVWGTICDDIKDQDAGNLMCRLLKFNTATAMHGSAYYGPGSGQIWLDDLQCSGTETALGDCRHRGWGVHNCGHNEDLSVTCS